MLLRSWIVDLDEHTCSQRRETIQPEIDKSILHEICAKERKLWYEVQVKRHHDKLQAEKEAAGIAKLQSSLPKLAKPVLAFALQDAQLDAEKALLVLRQFQSEAFDELNEIQRRRKHLRAHKSGRAKTPSKRAVSVSSGSGSDPESSDDRRNRHGKTRKHKHKKSSKQSSDKRHKHKKEKHKKEKRSKRSRHSPLPHSDDELHSKHGRQLEFGSFGIIRESDYSAKRPEFAAWASDIKRIDIEALPRGDERDLFREFLEDFNTCTLPHRRYYDLAVYARAHGGDAGAGARGEAAGVDDERQRRLELQAERKAREDDAARVILERMVLSDAQMSELKQREMMRLRAQDAYKTGDMGTANRLMKQLRPAEEGGPHNEGGEY